VNAGVDPKNSLFTVHTDGARAVAVGGAATAALTELEGDTWADHTPPFTSQLFGVWLTPGEGGYAVGMQGAVLHRDPDGWVSQQTNLGFIPALHAVWVDDRDGVWAVGGQILSTPLSDGVIIHFGSPVNGAGIVEEGP
jgi:photosystem II stability/assembly factor-like uncharacterized protein